MTTLFTSGLKTRALKIGPLLLALAAIAIPAMPAVAKDHGRGHDKHERYRYYDDHRRDDDHRWRDDDDNDRRYGDRDGYWRDGRWYGYGDGRNRRYHPNSGHWDNGRRGPPPWARGRDYRGYGYRNVYYVPLSDYGRYRLYRPDYGYRWMRDDRNNFLLVAAATGIISQILSRGY